MNSRPEVTSGQSRILPELQVHRITQNIFLLWRHKEFVGSVQILWGSMGMVEEGRINKHGCAEEQISSFLNAILFIQCSINSMYTKWPFNDRPFFYSCVLR
jgi:hypothetical protein